MSKSLNKVLALVLVLVMAMGMAACGGSSAPATTEEPAAEAETAPAAEAPAAEEPAAEVPSYTFNDYQQLEPPHLGDQRRQRDPRLCCISLRGLLHSRLRERRVPVGL